MTDPMEKLIMEELIGGSVDDAIRKASLLAAVQSKIFCDVKGTVLDVRTAVLVKTTGQHYVMCGPAWDEYETRVRKGIARLGFKVTDVIDGRTFTA